LKAVNQLLLLLLPPLLLVALCRLLWCMRVLSGLAAAGLKLDKFGVLQLCSPGLSDVLITQLGVVAVLQTFLKRTVSSSRSTVESSWTACTNAFAHDG
jgi:hypothetical protein